MSKIVQEKFEVRYPQRPEGVEGGGWQDDKSARIKKGTQDGNNVFYNSLPPGQDIENQECADVRQQPEVMSGQSDVSMDYTQNSVKYGYTRREIRPTDDMYTREHNDAFYDEITLETESGSNTGFLERNNMLDRM